MSRSLQKTDLWSLLGILAALVFVVGARALPHPWNWTPMGAVALFAGARFTTSWKALLFTLVSLLLADAILGFHINMPFVYLGFFASTLMGYVFLKRSESLPRVLGLSTLSATLFFLISNFGVWYSLTMYPKNAQGLMEAYVAAIPFYHSSLLGDLFYGFAVWSVLTYAEKLRPSFSSSSN